MITSQYLLKNFDSSTDIFRMGTQVIGGVGFLGIGAIIVTGRNQARGLTTTASLWVCACIGQVARFGYIDGVFITLALLIFSLRIIGKLDVVVCRHAKVFDLYLEFVDNKGLTQFVEKMREECYKISMLQIEKGDVNEGSNAAVRLEIQNHAKREILLETFVAWNMCVLWRNFDSHKRRKEAITP